MPVRMARFTRLAASRGVPVLTRRDVHAFLSHQLHIRKLRPELDALEPGFFLLLGDETEQILLGKPVRQVVQIRRKRYRSLETLEPRFASGLLGHLGEITLAPIDAPQTVAVMPDASSEDRVDHHSRALRFVNGGIDVRI